eukprot:scaffold319_cov244-Pinguiococcus_pyrenoidosus.AAC.14
MRDNLDFEAPILVALGAVLLTAFLLVIPRKKTHPAALESYVGGKKHCLVTGGSGYIGSHTCLALLEAGFEVRAESHTESFGSGP